MLYHIRGLFTDVTQSQGNRILIFGLFQGCFRSMKPRNYHNGRTHDRYSEILKPRNDIYERFLPRIYLFANVSAV